MVVHPRSSVLEALLKLCSAAESQGIWSTLGVDSDVYRGPEHPIASLCRLSEEFTELDLLSASVAQETDAGEGLLPAPGWSRPGSLLVALRRAAEQAPFDILSDHGALTGNPALLSGLDDSRTIAAIDEEHSFLLVASSLDDLAALRSAGLPVTLADGILPIDPHKLNAFYNAQILQHPRAVRAVLRNKPRNVGSDSHVAGQADFTTGRLESIGAPELIFVAWSPFALSLEEPPCLALIRESFRLLGRHLKVDVGELYQWAPTAHELESLRFRLEFGAPQSARDLLRQSIDDNSVVLIDDGVAEETPLAGFEVAFSNLQRAVAAFRRDQNHRVQLQNSLDDYFRAIERDLLEPLRSQGLTCRSPMRRNLHLAASEICRQVHYQSYWARAAAELLGRKIETRDKGPESFLRAVSALTSLAARLLA